MSASSGNYRHYLQMAGVCLLVLVLAGSYLFYHRDILFPQKQDEQSAVPNSGSQAPKRNVIKPSVRPAVDPDEEARTQALESQMAAFHRLVITPTTDEQAQIPPDLLVGIPPEAGYQQIPLSEVAVTYTESQFQKDREAWYRKLFADEYLRAGHRDSMWDDRAIQFLSESGRRVSITRFRNLRHPQCFQETFDDHLSDAGQEIIDLGCNDPLVRVLIVEELERQGRHEQAHAAANQLVEHSATVSYSDVIEYQITRPKLRSNQGSAYYEQLATLFRKAIASLTLTDLEKRILYEEGRGLLEPARYEVLAEFVVSLECQSKVDPWLKKMVLGDFYRWISVDMSMLAWFWPSYQSMYEQNSATIRPLHMNHLRKAHRQYLEASQLEPGLPESFSRLFQMSFEQVATDIEYCVLPPGERTLDRLSEASPRYWFDRTVAVQFDYRPVYRQYRAAVIPSGAAENDWKPWESLFAFGIECLESQRFETDVPLGFHEAIQAMVRKSEYEIPPSSLRNRRVYALPDVLEPLQRMIAGYEPAFTDSDRKYYASLMVGIEWNLGHRDEAKRQLEALGSGTDQSAFRELYLDVVELQREFAGARTGSGVSVAAGEIQGMRLLPARRQLIFSLDGGRYRTWDLDTKQAIGEHTLLPAEEAPPIENSISESGQFVASYKHPIMKLCETASFKEVASLSFPEELKSYEISRTGRYVAAAVGEKVEIWEASPQRRIAEIDVHADDVSWRDVNWKPALQHVRAYTFSEDDALVAFVRGSKFDMFPTQVGWSYEEAPFLVNRLYVWDLQKNELVCEDQPFVPNITSMQFAESGEHLLVAGTRWSRFQRAREYVPEVAEHHSIKRIDPRTSETIQEYLGPHNSLWVPTEYGKESSLIVAMAKRELMVWDAATGAEVTSLQSHSSDVQFMCPSRELNTIVSIDSSGIMNDFTGEFQPDVRPIFIEPDYCGNHSPQRILFHPPTKRMAVCNQNSRGVIWDFSNTKSTIGRAYLSSGPVGTTALDFSPDFQQLATTDDAMPGVAVVRELQKKAPMSIWDTTTGKVVRVLEGETSVIECARFEPTARFVLAGLRDGTIVVWDLQSESNRPDRALKNHLAAVTQLEFSPDGRFLISGGQGGEAFGKPFSPSVKVWEMTGEDAQLKVVRTLELNGRPLDPFGFQSLAVSADGNWILATYGSVTSLLSLDDKLSCEVAGSKAVFMPDGSGFLTAGGAKLAEKVVLWDFNGRKIREFEGGHRRPITSLAFSPGGDAFLSASLTEGIAAWRASTGERILYIADLFP